MAADAPITELLVGWKAGNEAARDQVFTLLYEEIRTIARQQRRRWNGNHTMNTTALVHGLYEKLAKQGRVQVADRHHFYRLTGQVIRHILVDYAKKKTRQKRASDAEKAPIHELDGVLQIDAQAEELIDIDRALAKLGVIDKRMAQVVEMHFFAGFTYQEIGDVLDLSKKTVHRDWTKARAILHRELRGAGTISGKA